VLASWVGSATVVGWVLSFIGGAGSVESTERVKCK